MDKLKLLVRRVKALRKSTALLFNIPEDQVTIDVFVHRSPEALQAAIQANWEERNRQGLVWRVLGDPMVGLCITIFHHDYPRAPFSPRPGSVGNNAKE